MREREGDNQEVEDTANKDKDTIKDRVMVVQDSDQVMVPQEVTEAEMVKEGIFVYDNQRNRMLER